MKRILPLIILIILSSHAFAESFKLGSKELSLGLGLDNNVYGGSYTSSFPPISVMYDYGFKDQYGPGVISLGGIAGYTSIKTERITLTGTAGEKYTVFILGFRSAYHMQFVPNLDTYGGLGLYYKKPSVSYFGQTTVPRPVLDADLDLALIIGAKYYFNNKMAGLAELGINTLSVLTIGVVFKL